MIAGASDVRYARTGDGLSIAYASIGDGPVTLVLSPGLVSQLEMAWEEPAFSSFYERLASWSRLLVFDRWGVGLSDGAGAAEHPKLEDLRDDVTAVLDDSGSADAVLLGFSLGAMTAIRFAIDCPARVKALIVIGGTARWMRSHDYAFGPGAEDVERMAAELAASWGGGVTVATVAPSMVDDRRFCAWTARLERHSCSPGTIDGALRSVASFDLRSEVAQIRVPTLVIHRSGDRMVDVEHARYLATHISGARYVELDGRDHLMFLGHREAILRAVVDFVATTLECEELLARGTRARNATRWASLTPREADVAELVAHGLTNAEIARRLYVSPHTIDKRLRRAYAKAGVFNRAQLAAQSARGDA